MEVKQLEREVYAGKQFTARYHTKGEWNAEMADPRGRMENSCVIFHSSY